jgi:hypothetical protein
MTSLSITIEAEGKARQMSETGLSILLGLTPEDIRRRLTWYLGIGPSPWGSPTSVAQPTHHEGTPGEGGRGKGHVTDVVPHVTEERNKHVTESERDGTERHGLKRSEHHVHTNVDRSISLEPSRAETDPLADRLADALDDHVSLACYRNLTHDHPEELLLRALKITLDTPPELLRRGRGAYFMGVVRRLASRETI